MHAQFPWQRAGTMLGPADSASSSAFPLLNASSIADFPRPAPEPAERFSPIVVLGAIRAMDVALLLTAAVLSASTGGAGGGRVAGVLLGALGIYTGIAVLAWSGAYRLSSLSRSRDLLIATLAAGPAIAGAHALGATILAAMSGKSVAAAGLTGGELGASAMCGLVAGTLLLAARLPLTLLLGTWRESGRMYWRVALLGANERAVELRDRLAGSRGKFVRIDAVYRLDGEPAQPGLPHLGGLDALVLDSRRCRFDAVVIVPPEREAPDLGALLARLGSVVADIHVAMPDRRRVDRSPAGGARTPAGGTRTPAGGTRTIVPTDIAIQIARQPIKEAEWARKRVFDVLLSVLLLFVVAPAMLVIALAIRLTSRGPALFRQSRTGFNNREFVALKFRTMRCTVTDPASFRQTTRDDPRVTPFGRVLRRFSIDELPQLFNVLRGEMSLVGPRPHAPATRAAGILLPDAVDEYIDRHRVKPGITGWAQVNGLRGATETVAQLRARVEHDLYYIENWSLGFDIRILALTLLREIRSKHAC